MEHVQTVESFLAMEAIVTISGTSNLYFTGKYSFLGEREVDNFSREIIIFVVYP
jgi:hypothetical protein